MAAITPTFSGSYSGQLIYNMTNYVIGDSFKNYVESVEIVYRDIYKPNMTGFDTGKFTLNKTDATYLGITIGIMLVGNLPHWLAQQLLQLAKGCYGSGMSLILNDDWITNKDYYCKWVNAGDFVENTMVLAGGSLQFEVWKVE